MPPIRCYSFAVREFSKSSQKGTLLNKIQLSPAPTQGRMAEGQHYRWGSPNSDLVKKMHRGLADHTAFSMATLSSGERAELCVLSIDVHWLRIVRLLGSLALRLSMEAALPRKDDLLLPGISRERPLQSLRAQGAQSALSAEIDRALE